MHFRIIVIVRYGIWFPVFSLNFSLQALHSGFLPLWGIFLHSFISCFYVVGLCLVCLVRSFTSCLLIAFILYLSFVLCQSFCIPPLFSSFILPVGFFCFAVCFLLYFFFFVLWAPVCSHNITLYFLFLPNLLHDKYCFMLKSQHNTKD